MSQQRTASSTQDVHQMDYCTFLDYTKEMRLNNIVRLCEIIDQHDKTLKKHQDELTYTKKGDALAAIGENTKAIDCYNKALKINPGYVPAHTHMGAAWAAIGEHEDAMICYDAALKHNTLDAHAHAHTHMGISLSAIGRYEEARICYNKALKINPDYVPAHTHMGAAWAATGRHQEAIDCYQNAIKIQQDADIHTKMGISFAALGRHEEAIACYTKADHVHQGYPPAYHHLSKSYAALEQPAQEEKGKIINTKYAAMYSWDGHFLYQREYQEGAVASYNKSLQFNKNNAQVHYNKGKVLAALGGHKYAIDCYNETLTVDPHYADSVKVYQDMGISFAALGDHENAIVYYKKVITVCPNAAAYTGIANSLLYLKQCDEARNFCDQAIKISPNSETYTKRGNIEFYFANDYDKAIEYYTFAIKSPLAETPTKMGISYSSKAEAYTKMGMSYSSKAEALTNSTKCSTQAMKYYQQAIDIDPDYVSAYHLMARALSCAGEDAEAERMYQKISELYTRNDETLYSHKRSLDALGYEEWSIASASHTTEQRHDYEVAREPDVLTEEYAIHKPTEHLGKIESTFESE